MSIIIIFWVWENDNYCEWYNDCKSMIINNVSALTLRVAPSRALSCKKNWADCVWMMSEYWFSLGLPTRRWLINANNIIILGNKKR